MKVIGPGPENQVVRGGPWGIGLDVPSVSQPHNGSCGPETQTCPLEQLGLAY